MSRYYRISFCIFTVHPTAFTSPTICFNAVEDMLWYPVYYITLHLKCTKYYDKAKEVSIGPPNYIFM